MPGNTYYGMQHLNNSMMCSIAMLTTGKELGNHELIEIAALPLDVGLEPRTDKHIFHMSIKPERVDNIGWNTMPDITKPIVANSVLRGHSPSVVGDLFIKWFESLKLQTNKQIVPLSWNWPLHCQWLRPWLGTTNFDHLFDWKYRDVLSTVNHINDTLDLSANTIVFPKITLGSLADRNKLIRIRPETALTRAKLIAEIYKSLCAFRTRPMI